MLNGTGDGAPGARPAILGILNASPESISGNRFDAGTVAEAAERLVADGADVLDIGAQSLRTDQPELPVDDEIDRLLPVLAAVRERLPSVAISVDTYRHEVAAAAAGYGIDLINDPSGLHDEGLCEVVGQHGLSLVLAHNPGAPKVRRPADHRPPDPVGGCREFLAERLDRIVANGVPREQVILDPGPDLYKAPDHTIAVLRAVPALRRELGVARVLWAVSRKDFVGALLDAPPSGRGAGTLGALAALPIEDGDLVRVHDVRSTAEFFTVQRALLHGHEGELRLAEHLRYDPS